MHTGTHTDTHTARGLFSWPSRRQARLATPGPAVGARRQARPAPASPRAKWPARLPREWSWGDVRLHASYDKRLVDLSRNRFFMREKLDGIVVGHRWRRQPTRRDHCHHRLQQHAGSTGCGLRTRDDGSAQEEAPCSERAASATRLGDRLAAA